MYAGGINVLLGNEIRPSKIQDPPVKVWWPAEKCAYYTLIKYNIDGPSRAKPVNRGFFS